MMKPIHLHSWIGGAAVMLMLSLAASCTDEEMFQRPDTGNGIAFLPSIVNKGWSAGDSTQTRALTPASRHSVTELRNAQGGRTLYLHTTETDSIAAPTAPDTARIATRGALVTTTTAFEEQYGSFGVLAWAYQGEWSDTQELNYIDNAKATASGGTYGFNPPYFWPGETYNMAFFAYAPYDEDGTIFSEKRGAPTLTYSVPTDITEQKDLLAYWIKEIDEKNKRKTIDLNFSHLCTAIKFKVGEGLENAITSISIKNVYGSGTYSVADGKWTPTGEANVTYTLDVNPKNTPQDTELTTGENIFMMIPQILPQDAEIEVTFMENGQKQILTASISDKKEWKKGHTVIYTISRTEVTENIYFTVKATNKEVDYQGGELSFTVKSYKETTKNGSTTTISMPWKITGYKVGESTEWSKTVPTWLTLTTQGTGSSQGENEEMTVTAQTSYTANPQNEALKAAAEIAGPYNLSTRGGKESMNTANSYIVNAPGTYTLPLVYGNAIVDGETNESAYKTKNSGEGILQTFINHLGRSITSPYIYENEDEDGNKLSAQKAELLWQDVKGLVTDVQLTNEGKVLQFKVNKDVIEQGNAVVAISDSEGTIMWSWHIWVTDYNPYETGDNFFNRYLGFCYNDTKIYDPRTVTLRFEQEGTDKEVELTITQTEHRIEDGNCPFYQFGRKDPMLPGTTSTAEAVNKTWYDAQGTASTEISTVGEEDDRGNKVIIYCMKNPDKFCAARWMDFVYYNNWATNDRKGESTSKKTSVKTVYDPSPAGYQVPTRGLGTAIRSVVKDKKQFYSGYRYHNVNNDGKVTKLKEAGTNFRIYTSLVSTINEIEGGTQSNAYSIWSFTNQAVDRGMANSILPAKENSK